MYAQLILIPIPVTGIPVSIFSHATYHRGVHEDELMIITQTTGKEIRMNHDITSTNDATAIARLNFEL